MRLRLIAIVSEILGKGKVIISFRTALRPGKKRVQDFAIK